MAPSALPVGLPLPPDGVLPFGPLGPEPFSAYVHIPFCRVRCGYCDFNTYTATELGGGANQSNYAQTLRREIALAARMMHDGDASLPTLRTVFFGGGTPTLLPAADLVAILTALREEWELAPGAEVTTEANPDSVDAATFKTLKAAGFTRVSIGMQSAEPAVLATLERTHNPENVGKAVRWARDAGLDVSLDLIYGTPGESPDSWRRSLGDALELAPDHVSAYALIVEEGTKLAAQVRRGEVPDIDDDDHADKYVLADELLSAAGYTWYEVSNWARTPAHESQHNLAYWRGHNWWGFGPGAHSHINGVRWWNVKHPTAYAGKLENGDTPGAGYEKLTPDQAHMEQVLLKSRIREGLPIAALARPGSGDTVDPGVIAGLIARGLIDPQRALAGTIELTLQGRLLADAVVHELLPT